MLTYYLELIQVQWDHNLEDSVIYINGVSILYHPKICVKVILITKFTCNKFTHDFEDILVDLNLVLAPMHG